MNKAFTLSLEINYQKTVRMVQGKGMKGVVLFVLFIIGIGLMGAGTYKIFELYKLTQQYETVRGHICRIDKERVTRRPRKLTFHYTARVKYEVDGRIYNEKLPFYMPFSQVGDEVSVSYDPEHPYEMKVLGYEWLRWGGILMGGVLVELVVWYFFSVCIIKVKNV